MITGRFDDVAKGPPDMTDILITGGRIIDGTGNPWFYGDVAISGRTIERIAPAGTIDRSPATTVIDASGHVVCPGFIDIQSHSLIPWLYDSRLVSKTTQGITTEIMGEGWTPAPFVGKRTDTFRGALINRIGEEEAEKWERIGQTWTRFDHWLNAFEEIGGSANFGSFIGGSTVRQIGMADAMGEADEEALDLMRTAIAECMEDGAFGIATALIYPPNAFSSTAELIAQMEVVARYNGVHITHMRSEGDLILEALEETLQIARETGVATEIYHLKAAGTENWPKMPRVIERINEARAEGIDVTADMYPYDGSGTGLAACMPPWASADGKRQENLRDPEMRAKIVAEMKTPQGDWENLGERCGPANVILAQFAKDEMKRYQGRTLEDVAAELGMPWQDAVCDLLDRDDANIFTIYIGITEANIELQVKQDWIKFSTDAGGVDPEVDAARGLVHPRAYGTYPRVLGPYVRENQWMTLEDAVRKCTSAVADRLHLRDRGQLRDGFFADVVIFDPETVSDHATWSDPHRLSTGIRDVLVNGTPVIRDNAHTGAKPGMRVNGPGYRRGLA
jgi:dihydroorotase/N-acyl-D-amino-acid deacylase